MTKYSLDQIKQAHQQKKNYDRQFPLSYFVVRKISFYLAYLILKVTESPSRVAYCGLVIGSLGCVALFLMNELSVWPGILLLILYDLLDAADGNIARVTGNVTLYGKFLDGVIGELVESNYPLWLAFGLYRCSANSQVFSLISEDFRILLPVLGVSILAGNLHSSQIMGNYYAYYSYMTAGAETTKTDPTQSIRTSQYSRVWWYLMYINLGSFDLQLLLIVVAAIVGALDVFLLFYAIYFLFRVVLYFGFYLRRASRTLI